MRKSNILSGCLFGVLTVVLLWQAFREHDRGKQKVYEDFGNWLDQNVFGDRDLHKRLSALLRFTQVHDELRGDYFAGRVTLEEAVDRIVAACQEHSPDFLPYIARTESGNSPQERIARSIARQLEENAELRQNDELRERLRSELADLLRKCQKPMPPMVGATAA